MPVTEGMGFRKGRLHFLTGIDMQMMDKRKFLYVGLNNLGLPTAIVPGHMERTCLLNKKKHTRREQKSSWVGKGIEG